MATGVEIRAQIDAENVRGLLLINGGGAVALLAFLPHVIGEPSYEILTKSILVALLMFQMGLLAAVISNRQRRVCSLKYEVAQASSPAYPDPCVLLGIEFREPCVCIRSIIFMWVSAVMFFLAGVVVFWGGWQEVGIYKNIEKHEICSNNYTPNHSISTGQLTRYFALGKQAG